MRGCPAPDCGSTCNRYSPDSSEKYAMYLPSGDHAGSRSATPDVFVRLRISPFFAGTVKTSPRASNRARLPLGDSVPLRIYAASLTREVRNTGKSPDTRISIALLVPECKSYRWI